MWYFPVALIVSVQNCFQNIFFHVFYVLADFLKNLNIYTNIYITKTYKMFNF